MSLIFIVVAIVLMAASGLPGVFAPRRSVWGQSLAVVMTVVGAVVGLAGAGLGLLRPEVVTWVLPFPMMGGQPLLILDALSAFFLVPVLLMGALGSIYGLGYWPQSRHLRTGRKLRFFWGVMIGGMALLLVGRTAFVFLLGWEMMALSAFFLVSTEDHLASSREAGWVYFIATHVGTLGLFALFALWRWATGSFDLVPAVAGTLSIGVQHSIFLLALLVFGLKAGMMPLHFWLPTAHANAPSHVSAILSGVVLKIGIYGLLRTLSLLPNPPVAWGGLILLLAACSALLGVVFALGQHDLKRLLAYHSVENIGIILMGLGLALLGRALDRPTWMVLGMAGCLLHVWNHSFFKSLLFFCAGSVVHGTGTREIDRLGGLAQRMPGTALLFQIGAVAICGLPPLNGFVSEFLIYLGLLATVVGSSGGGSVVALAAPVLAMVGALAVACFVKVTGAVFLGAPRTVEAARATEVPWSMRGPAWVLAGLCILIGLVPLAVAPLLDGAISAGIPELRAGEMRLRSLVPLGSVSLMAVALLVTIVLIRVWVNPRERSDRQVGTWDCGYARPTTRMQYTSSSFAQMIVSMFAWVLRPHTQWPKIEGLFARPTQMRSHVDDPILDRVLLPTGRTTEGGLRWFHRFQQGLTQQYVLYILLTVIVMLAALIPFAELFERLLTF
jgi:hydrogenase-4 component B